MFVTSDGVRVRSVARHTATHGVAVSVHGAGCSGATGCGTAGVRGPGSHREMAGPPAQSVVQDHGGARELLGRDAAVHGAATGDVALQAGTDRVALVVHHTLGPSHTYSLYNFLTPIALSFATIYYFHLKQLICIIVYLSQLLNTFTISQLHLFAPFCFRQTSILHWPQG